MSTDEDYKLEQLKELLAQNPADLELRIELGEELLEHGMAKEALAHWCVAAEMFAEHEDYLSAVGLLNRLLDVQPHHEKAQSLLSSFYAKVPRQPTARFTVPGAAAQPVSDMSVEPGSNLFKLPEESARALAQLLPFVAE
ncbi:MAG: hypothetical protein KC561_19965, partial [Myxococcales bacterium]|nr:hypothetical protein [Myxococcales bacterium]